MMNEILISIERITSYELFKNNSLQSFVFFNYEDYYTTFLLNDIIMCGIVRLYQKPITLFLI